jgi:hypothetical protein
MKSLFSRQITAENVIPNAFGLFADGHRQRRGNPLKAFYLQRTSSQTETKESNICIQQRSVAEKIHVELKICEL